VKKLGRLLTAMVTPFDKEGKVDYEQAKKLALALLHSGSDGVVLVATTGESPTLLRDEEACLLSEVKSTMGERGSVPTIINQLRTACTSILRLLRRALAYPVYYTMCPPVLPLIYQPILLSS